MSVIPDRKDYKNVERAVVTRFVEQLVRKGYASVSHVDSDERSHFERFGLVKEAKRVTVVYDVKAKMVSITAFEEQMGEICAVFEKSRGADDEAAKLPFTPRDNRTPATKADAKQPARNRRSSAAPSGRKPSAGEQPKNVSQKAEKPFSDAKNRSGETKSSPEKTQPPPKKAAEQSKKSALTQTAAATKQTAPLKTGKNDFALKKYTAERFEAAVESLKAGKIRIKLKSRQGSGALRVDVYEVSSGSAKLTVCYMPEKKILQIQGKATDFSRKVQTLFSESVDYKSAVKAHIEQKQTDERTATVEKRLKKHLPVGCMYLSPQAKIDFSIGIVDLLTGNIVLSDYSSLLIPPYRGLERLIFDLEQAQGIKVKMIGQAYEKDERGEYCLKAVYRKRIGSIVFAEVMASLYTEYNSTRNFYVHSAAGGQTKVINDKNQAVAIYENMLAVVEYNAKKLREIGFTLKQQ